MNSKDPAFIAPDYAEKLPVPGTVKPPVDEYGDQPKAPKAPEVEEPKPATASEAVAQHCVEVDALIMDMHRVSPSGLEGIEAKIRASLKTLGEAVG